MPSKIPRETLHEILRTMLKDTLVPMARALNCLYVAVDESVARDLGKKCLSDAVILACVRDVASRIWKKNDYGKDIASLSYGGGFIIRDYENFEQHFYPPQLCAEVRAALGVSHE